MKTNQLFLLTGLATVALPACVQKDKKEVPEKPMNILYIMCDDHSYQTISAYDQWAQTLYNPLPKCGGCCNG